MNKVKGRKHLRWYTFLKSSWSSNYVLSYDREISENISSWFVVKLYMNVTIVPWFRKALPPANQRELDFS